jgi:hypothetical protein
MYVRGDMIAIRRHSEAIKTMSLPRLHVSLSPLHGIGIQCEAAFRGGAVAADSSIADGSISAGTAFEPHIRRHTGNKLGPLKAQRWRLLEKGHRCKMTPNTAPAGSQASENNAVSRGPDLSPDSDSARILLPNSDIVSLTLVQQRRLRMPGRGTTSGVLTVPSRSRASGFEGGWARARRRGHQSGHRSRQGASSVQQKHDREPLIKSSFRWNFGGPGRAIRDDMRTHRGSDSFRAEAWKMCGATMC